MSSLWLRLLVAALVAVALVAGGWWLQSEYEFRQVEQRNENTREVRAHPWLTLQRLLEHRGAVVTTLEVLTVMPPPGATLHLMEDRSNLSRQQSQALLDWVRAGGSLVVTPVSDTPLRRQPDPLLDPLGARREDSSNWMPGRWDARHCMALLPQGGGALDLPYGNWHRLQVDPAHPPLWRLDDCAGLRMLAWQVGKGRLVATEDAGQFTNFRLRQRDLAPLAVWLFAPRPGSVVWLVGNEGLPPLPVLMARWAPLATTGLVLWLAALLWRTGITSGPRRDLPQAGRRSLAEHLRAAAGLLWRADRGIALHALLRQSALDRLRRRHPAWRDLADAELVRRAGQLAGLDGAPLDHVLQAPPADDVQAFAHRFKTLETLRKTA